MRASDTASVGVGGITQGGHQRGVPQVVSGHLPLEALRVSSNGRHDNISALVCNAGVMGERAASRRRPRPGRGRTGRA